MPIDAESVNRYEAVATAKRWRAYQAKPFRVFQTEQEDWESLLQVPRLPDQAREKLVAGGSVNKFGRYNDPTSAKWKSVLREIDTACRAGLRFSSTLLLITEIITKSFQQSDGDGISRKDTGAVIALLGPISRLVFDQFARTSVRSTRARRDIVMDQF